MIIGLIIVGTAAAAWFLAPDSLTRLLNQQAEPVLVTVAPDQVYQEPGSAGAIILPESSALQYPSHATVEEAGREPPPPEPGQPVRLAIPAIGVDAPVVAVSLNRVNIGGNEVLQWGVPGGYAGGWHNESAHLGSQGNVVINGHNNILGEVFRDLANVPIGAEMTVYDKDRAYSYKVTQVETLAEQDQPLSVRLANAQWIEPTTDQRLTLVSCWPYETNSHRLIVVAVPSASP
ncbi:MAG: sortase [Anaerolineales bacterium]|nr:sortase [Anaerolineales bacterium]MCB0027086.1 sortase [Anaerolineales bacterium]MCB8962676.1 sortase [Ardenticatenales bacterium]